MIHDGDDNDDVREVGEVNERAEQRELTGWGGEGVRKGQGSGGEAARFVSESTRVAESGGRR